MTSDRICVVPRVHGVGGMVSFLHKFSAAAEKAGVQVSNDLTEKPYSAILVIGGTRQILRIGREKQRGVRVVQRLDGINWIHRKKPLSLKHSIRSEYGNLVLSVLRRYLADFIVYQSDFSRKWWNDWYGVLKTPGMVVHNAVNLSQYAPAGRAANRSYRLLVVEGTLGGGYESGLENAVNLANVAAPLLSKPLELMVVGEVSPALKSEWTEKCSVPIQWLGLVAREAISGYMNEAHALFSADLHPACPNSVIEALACGLPVVSYDTGSLSELVTPEAGFIAPYGSNSWNLEPPVVEPLARGLTEVLEHNEKFRSGARQRAEAAFDINVMMEKYLSALLG